MNAKQIERDLSNEEYRDILTELYGVIKIGNLSFDAGRIVEELDPIAFRCGKSDYESELDSENPIWACDCGEEYDDEDKANECCAEEAI